MRTHSCSALLTLSMLLASVAGADEATVTVHVDQTTAQLSPMLYGLFFEDINYAADGGLYAELIENRSFEYYPVTGWSSRSDKLRPLSSWEKVEREGGTVRLGVVDEDPLNENNTHYLSMQLDCPQGSAGVANTGFAGISLKQGAKYNFSAYARRGDGVNAKITVSLVSDEGESLASGDIELSATEWAKHELQLTPTSSAKQARLVLTATGIGTLDLDMVSLFPQATYKNRKNGMRPDLAQVLADLEPAFLRFPGGCIAHGQGLANAYRWKDTIGDVAERKPNWNLWGYHQTYGLGYFEYMQLCEDIGAEPLPVVPLGVSCGFRRPFENAPLDQMQPWIDDALDLIEFANGPADSEWGKVRAEMGHPEPFGLEYVCLGNEEHDTPEVRERFPLFVTAIRARYPEIKIIGTSGLSPSIPLYDLMVETDVHSSDEHYYQSPEWYLQNVNRFDSFDRGQPKIFIGEYASEGNRQANAVAEAVYLTGVERNADVVDMTCYAPLFAKYDYTQWEKADLIWFDNQQVVKTPNYYVQQLFSVNKGDVYCDNEVTMKTETVAQPFAGRVGIGTWQTAIEVAEASVNGEPIESSSMQTDGGRFDLQGDTLTQTDAAAQAAVALSSESFDAEQLVYKLRARKTAGSEGFLVVFAAEPGGQLYWWNIGGWDNTRHAIERGTRRGPREELDTTPGQIETGRWYDLRVELGSGGIKCFIDDTLVHHHRQPRSQVFASSTIDRSAGELIVKLVNPLESTVTTSLKVDGAKHLATRGQLITLAGPASATNDRQHQPIEPETREVEVSPETKIELPATSVQVLRVGIE